MEHGETNRHGLIVVLTCFNSMASCFIGFRDTSDTFFLKDMLNFSRVLHGKCHVPQVDGRCRR